VAARNIFDAFAGIRHYRTNFPCCIVYFDAALWPNGRALDFGLVTCSLKIVGSSPAGVEIIWFEDFFLVNFSFFSDFQLPACSILVQGTEVF
jgi:hypothetical protein